MDSLAARWAKVEEYVVAACAQRERPTDTTRIAATTRAFDAVAAVLSVALRQRLPAKRQNEKFELRIGGVRSDGEYVGGTVMHVQVGYYADGRLGEVFLDTSKEGSDLRHFMNGFAVALSLLLQVGVPVTLLAHAFGKVSGGPAGAVDGAEELGVKSARSMIDLTVKVLEALDARRGRRAH